MSNIVKFTFSPIVFDGALYALIAVFIFMQGYFSSDEAAKYVAPATLFWAKFIVGSLAAATGALKMFRSTTYADHVNESVTKPI